MMDSKWKVPIFCIQNGFKGNVLNVGLHLSISGWKWSVLYKKTQIYTLNCIQTDKKQSFYFYFYICLIFKY